MIRAIRRLPWAMLLSVTVSAALAQVNYPAQPVRLVVTTAPGGGLDTFARALAREFSDRAGQQFVVDNRPGAGTTIGTALVAKAKPDGYTVLVSTSSFAISPAIYRSIPYDPVQDFAPITMGASAPNLLVVHPSVPVKSVKELIALARARADQGDPIFYASGGSGTNGHMAAALFLDMAKIRMTHVPYKSGSLGVIDLIGGHVAVMLDTMSSVMPQFRAGKLRALGVSGARRAAAAPGIPTIAESGVPGYESMQWYGLWVPAGTSRDIIAWLHKESTSILRAPHMQKRLAEDGLDVVASASDDFAASIRADIAKWTRLVKAAGIQPM